MKTEELRNQIRKSSWIFGAADKKFEFGNRPRNNNISLKDLIPYLVEYNEPMEEKLKIAKGYFLIGKVSHELGKSQDALSYYDIAIGLNPKYSEAYCNRGILKVILKDLSGAIKDYNKAIEINPNYDNAIYNRGLAKYGIQNLKEALEDLCKAISLNNEIPDYYIDRGLVKTDLNDINGAIVDFNKAVELDSNNENIYFNRGIVYYLDNQR